MTVGHENDVFFLICGWYVYTVSSWMNEIFYTRVLFIFCMNWPIVCLVYSSGILLGQKRFILWFTGVTGLFNVFLSCPGLCDVLMVEEEELTQSVSSSCQYGVLICMDFFFFFFYRQVALWRLKKGYIADCSPSMPGHRSSSVCVCHCTLEVDPPTRTAVGDFLAASTFDILYHTIPYQLCRFELWGVRSLQSFIFTHPEGSLLSSFGRKTKKPHKKHYQFWIFWTNSSHFPSPSRNGFQSLESSPWTPGC